MMKVLTVLGARPQFIKAAAVSRVLRRFHQEVIVHTGQHYDENMSAVFFQELNIPLPDYNLGWVRQSWPPDWQMLAEVEEIIVKEQPDWALQYGIPIPLWRGLRSGKAARAGFAVESAAKFNRRMPEEINRVVTDSISTILACPTATAVRNPSEEGFTNLFSNGICEHWGGNFGYPERPLGQREMSYDAVLYT